MPVRNSRIWLGAALACLLAVLGCAAPGPELQVRDQRTGEIQYRTPAHDGQRVTLSWTHSVEHTKWLEVWEVDDDAFVLVETQFEGYGAGVPNEGEAHVENGMVHVTGIDRRVKKLTWVHSHDVSHSLTIDGAPAVEPGDLPHHECAELVVTGHTTDAASKRNNR